jgi:hypothetical protein
MGYVASNTPGVMPAIPDSTSATKKVPTFEEVEKALIKCNGLITYTAGELKCPVELVKKQIRKYKTLRILVSQLRDAMIDAAEDTLMYRIVEKRDMIASMFLLKTLGKKRGWVETEKAGGTIDKPVFIKILPAGEGGEKKKGGKLPKATIVETTIPAIESKISLTKKESELIGGGNAEEFIDAEIMEE